MKILLYDNTQMTLRDGRFYCASGTGQFAKELVELGNNVTMFGQQIEDASSTSSFDILSGGITVAGLGRYQSKLFSYLLLYCLSIKYIIKSDFVYFFYPTSYRFLPFVCRLIGKKYGLYVRGDKDINNKLSKSLYKQAYVVFTVAKMFTDMVNNICKKEVGHTIRPMISYTDTDVVKDRSYYSKDNYNLLFLCRLQKEKGLKELFEAMANLKKDNISNFYLTVVGGGPYLETARQKVKELGLVDFVSLEGNVDDEAKKKQYFLKSDIYILPTYYNEGFPRTLYEAMIFGTPILTTFVSGIPSLMADQYNCKKLEERSVKSIEDGLKYAMSNYEEMGEYARNATKTILQVVDPKRLSHAQDVDRIVRTIKK